MSNRGSVAIADWSPPPSLARLGEAEVHVWRARLDCGAEEVDRRAAVLDEGERARASQFRVGAARARYVVARGMLREILGRYLDMPADRLTFQQNVYGKPFLGGHPAGTDIRFNLSHAGAIALLAVSSGRDVGVDVEECVTRPSIARIAAHFFSTSEQAAIQALPASLQTRAFFATWTRKEAFVKARGEGLSLPLNRFSVETDPDRPARLTAADRPGELTRWSMATLAMDSPYAAALVAEGTGWRLNCWETRNRTKPDETHEDTH